MPTLAQVRDAVDTWLAGKWPTVQARQTTYFGNHGRYWQGLVTHLPVPAHTSSVDGSTAPNRLALKPTDIAQSWLDVLPEWLTELMPAAVWIDAYDGPDGKGYVASVKATHNGNTWMRSQNVGPETWRTIGWHQVVPGLP
jgi:hypothetical protein